MFEIGTSLREARLRRQIEFAEAEYGTKIRSKYLRALEDERFELLPSHTYIKGFLRSYAEYLGLDGQLYVDEYNSRYVVGEEDAPVRVARRVPAARARRAERRESKLVVLALLGIAIVTSLLIAAWRFGSPDETAVHGVNTNPRPASVPVASGQARLELRATQGRLVPDHPVAERDREGALPGDARARAEAALRRESALAAPRGARERPRQAERQPHQVRARDQGAGRLRDGEEGLRRRRDLSSAAARPRAVVVVTGSELVRGERTDLNGPFLARALLALGLEPARIEIVGDDAAELEAAVRDAVGSADLVVTSGGLGPTHDDRTVEVVAKVAGRALLVDEELEAEIEGVSRMVAERMKRPYADFAPGVTKQATLPEGAIALGLAGTAPGLVVDANGTPVVVLPGPPGELQRLWPNALETELVRRVLASGRPPLRRTLRLFGPGESQVAKAFHEAGGDGEGLEVTICARDFEVHVDLVAEPDAEARLLDLQSTLETELGDWVYSTDGRTVEELVLDRCRDRGLTLATAESCTGGLVAARLTAVPGPRTCCASGSSRTRTRRRSSSWACRRS